VESAQLAEDPADPQRAYRYQERRPSENIDRIRTLAALGAEEALVVLEEYALHDKRKEVQQELLKAFPCFDPESYGRRVIVHLDALGSVSNPKPEFRAALHWLSAPVTLDLHGRRTTDLSPLPAIPMLTSLNLTECRYLTDLGPLATLTRLQVLEMPYCGQVTDFSPLASLTSLTQLNLQHCTRLTSLDALAGLIHLTILDLSYCNGVTDLSPLAGCCSLESLDISRSRHLMDLGPLVGLPRLKLLRIRDLKLAVPKQLSEQVQIER
jgi:hypothetical protein